MITDELESFLDAHPKIDSTATFFPRECFGEWRITAFLGYGGSGEVYRVEHRRLKKVAALKVHVPHLDKSATDGLLSRLRFEREGKLLSENSYPFFPRFFDFGEDNGHLYMVMELLEPVELPRKEGEIVTYLLNLCKAVRVLHAHGLVHRDLKPQNVLRRKNGDLVLCDLGLVKEMSRGKSPSGESVTLVEGKVVGAGTLRYAAPEQFMGGNISPAADIHALGMIINECFEGRPPPEWAEIVSRCTSSIPALRYPTVDSFMEAVKRRNRSGNIRNIRIAALVVLFVCGTLIGLNALLGGVEQRGDFDNIFRHEGKRSIRQGKSGEGDWESLCEDMTTNVLESVLLNTEAVTNNVGYILYKKSTFRPVTNQLEITLVRLKGERHRFTKPLSLRAGREYRIIGPGVLDAALEAGAGSRVILENCMVINRSKLPLKESGILFLLRNGSYLNLTSIDRNPDDEESYIDFSDPELNALRYRGPEMVSSYPELRALEAHLPLHP